MQQSVLPFQPGPESPLSGPRQSRWYAVSTPVAAEPRACANLIRQGFLPFCPQVARTIRSGRRVRTELRPLFPGYVFVSLDLKRDAWRSVNGTFGVRQLVHLGGQPSPLPRGVVETLQEMSRALGRVDFSARLAVGEKVRFLGGPFADMIGALEHLDGSGRVRVLISLLGRETTVKTSAQELVPLR